MDLSTLKPNDLPERLPGMSNTEWMIEMVLSRKGSKADKAGVHILTTGGSAAIPVIAKAALDPKRKPAHCIRLLDLISEIGESLIATDVALLCKLLHQRSNKVADKAEEVLTNFCPDGPPPLIAPEILGPFTEDAYRRVEELKRLFGLSP